MKRILPVLLALAGLSSFGPAAEAKLRVVSSLQDFASIAQSIGGDRVETFALAKG
jgi:ABC-type Zn uptake system ZnuABC Zn-binding protein ZnuA